MKLNDSVFYSAPTASKSFQGIGHRVDSIVQLAVDQHISHPETIVATHTRATQAAREDIHYPNEEAVRKTQGCIFSKIVHHVNH
uniref:HUELLENLOS n=1 Tax=Solanum tuberosum TaxID=4113 RepID=M1A444_SOLTU